MRKKTVALIGCGRISHKHVEAYIGNQNRMELIALVDPDHEKNKEKMKMYSSAIKSAEIKCYSNHKDLLKSEKPDIVSIATPSGLHAEIAIDALKSGSHVVCEKPMALSTEDADRMITAAKNSKKYLAVCFQNRFNKVVIKTREALNNERFGKMLHSAVQIRWNRNENYYKEASWRGTWEQDGGTLMNQCTHGIDLLQWMMRSDAVRVQAVIRRFQRPIEAEDFGAALVEFRDGSVGLIEGTANVFPTNLEESLSLFGQNGTAVLGGLAVNLIKTWRFLDSAKYGDSEDLVLSGNEKDPPSVYGYGHTALYSDFIDSIEFNREPAINGVEGKKALEIILAIYQSQLTGKPVDLPTDFSTMRMEGIFK